MSRLSTIILTLATTTLSMGCVDGEPTGSDSPTADIEGTPTQGATSTSNSTPSVSDSQDTPTATAIDATPSESSTTSTLPSTTQPNAATPTSPNPSPSSYDASPTAWLTQPPSTPTPSLGNATPTQPGTTDDGTVPEGSEPQSTEPDSTATAAPPTATTDGSTADPSGTPVATPTGESATASSSDPNTPTAVPPTPTPAIETPIVEPTPTEFDENAIFFDPDHLVEVHVEMDPDDYEEMANQSRYILHMTKGEDCGNVPRDSPYTWFEADVTIDGTLVENVGVRKKGFIGSSSTSKPGMKIKFDKFVDDQEFNGLERFTMNNGVQDPSLIHQCMAYGILTDIGIPSPRCNFTRVTVNGEYKGIYVHIEAIKKDFLADHFPDNDGDLYEGTLSDFRDEFWGSFQPKTGDTDEDLGPIIDVREALKVDDDELLDSVGEFIDIDAYITFWAAEVMIGHWDGYNSNSNNFLVYRDPDLEKMYFIPWGTDGAMYDQGFDSEDEEEGIPPSASIYGSTAIPFRLYALPEIRETYVERLSWLLDNFWDVDALLTETERMEALIMPHVLDPIEMEEGLGVIRSFISERRSYLDPELEAGGADNPTEALRAPLCFPLVGTLDMSFETTWDSLAESSPQNYGYGLLSYTNLDDSFGPAEGGAVAGFSSEDPKADMKIDVWANDSLLGFYHATLTVPHEWAAVGTYEVDGQGSLGYLEFSDPRLDSAVPLGFFVDGPLTIETISTESGATIKGTCTADLYDFSE